MKVFEAIETRRSVRKYLDKPVEAEKLQRVAEAFRLSPSARNSQTWELLVVQSPELRQKIVAATLGSPAFLAQAPVILVACGLKQDTMSNSHRVDTTDVSIAAGYSVLAAWEEGLGTCWMASYEEETLRAALSLPATTSIVMISPLGYPAEEPNAKPRKSQEEVIRWL